MQEKIEALRNLAVAPQALFINGLRQDPVEGAVLAVVSPIDGRRLTTIADAGAEDIDQAPKAEPGSAAGTFRYYGEAIDKVYGEIAPASCMSTPVAGPTAPCRSVACASPATGTTSPCTRWTNIST
ncbi:hypothetical protein AB3G45_00255 [Shinella sp. S4-D37]|uniref:hypothetical protein n=1 Tax=Shinella sp. S4-D37 TaxID=3161999 RepID=UPI00346784B3